jgi:hypothetical protein
MGGAPGEIGLGFRSLEPSGRAGEIKSKIMIKRTVDGGTKKTAFT